jgi:hypothetical protein
MPEKVVQMVSISEIVTINADFGIGMMTGIR